MRNLHLSILLIVLSPNLALCQKQKFHELAPVKGYYKDLQSFSAKPVSQNVEIDKQKFPFDPASAEKRLSLKPYYLDGVKLEDFNIPGPPANSSEQTLAELNYLLQLPTADSTGTSWDTLLQMQNC